MHFGAIAGGPIDHGCPDTVAAILGAILGAIRGAAINGVL
jgi:hypothetical protein